MTLDCCLLLQIKKLKFSAKRLEIISVFGKQSFLDPPMESKHLPSNFLLTSGKKNKSGGTRLGCREGGEAPGPPSWPVERCRGRQCAQTHYRDRETNIFLAEGALSWELSYRKPLPILRQRSKLSGLVDNVIAESRRPFSWCVALLYFRVLPLHFSKHKNSTKTKLFIEKKKHSKLVFILDHTLPPKMRVPPAISAGFGSTFGAAPR
ncbi:hypothetical protein J6590_020154 [Homalodisca vitripennis]|nr:hypothetical protein J6590_020154 [Homalodisca vitripennis]